MDSRRYIPVASSSTMNYPQQTQQMYPQQTPQAYPQQNSYPTQGINYPSQTPNSSSITYPQTRIPVSAPTTGLPSLIPPWSNPALLQSPSYNGVQLPLYFRTTTALFPANQELVTKLGIPMSLIISPMKVDNVPLINQNKLPLIRCKNCSSYFSPYCKILPDGKSWVCPLCGNTSTYSDLSDPISLYDHPEHSYQVYDVLTPSPYISLPNAGSVFIFVIDTSASAFRSQFTPSFLQSLLACLPSIPEDTRVGLVSFDSTITIYDLAQTHQYIYTDLSQDFSEMDLQIQLMPLSLVRKELETAIQFLLKYPETHILKEGHCVFSALTACAPLVKGTGGCIYACFFNPPSHGPLAIPPRPPNETELNLIHLAPNSPGKQLRSASFMLNRAGATINQYIGFNNFTDCAVLSIPAGLTGGSLHTYPTQKIVNAQFNKYQQNQQNGQDSIDLTHLHLDLFADLMAKKTWNSTLRLRCSAWFYQVFIYLYQLLDKVILD